MADFKSQFDRNVVVPDKIKAALASLRAEGPEAWEYEGEFVKRAQISQTDIGAFREQFEKHIVVAKSIGGNHRGDPRRVWFADPKVAAKVR